MLAGLLLVVAGAWTWYAFNQLQQRWLLDVAASALQRAGQRGLALRPLGYRARLIARGQGVVVEWRAGILGPRSVVRDAAGSHRVALLRDAVALERALDGAAGGGRGGDPPAAPDDGPGGTAPPDARP